MANDKTKQYRFIGSHADMLASGRPVEPGEFVDLTDDELREPHNTMLLDDELLLLIKDEDTHDQEIATDAAKRLAASNKIDLAEVPATGANGLITQGDVEQYIADKSGEES